MIDFVEVRDKTTREVIGIIDTAQSIIWKSSYYSVGSFEIYTSASKIALECLVEDNYVTRLDNDECGIIESVEITDSADEGSMIIASGRFVKSLLDRRVVYYPTLKGTGLDYVWSCSPSVLEGNVEGAVRKLIYDNAIDAYQVRQDSSGSPIKIPYSARNIPEIHWTDEDVTGISDVISSFNEQGTAETDAEKQVTYKNLLEYTDSVLQEYECGAKMWLDTTLLKFRYKVYRGEDRSRDSLTHEPVIFSKEYDNLLSSTYKVDVSTQKTTALIGGEGEGTDRKCALAYDWISGIDRRETFVDASSTAQEGIGIQDYRKQLESQGQQSIKELGKIEAFDGEIDVTNSNLIYGKDYNLGDIVTIEDKKINKYINARILTVTEVEDGDGYKIDIEYGV